MNFFVFRMSFQTSTATFVGFHRQIVEEYRIRMMELFIPWQDPICLAVIQVPTSWQTNYFNIFPHIVILHIGLDRSLLIASILLSSTISLNYKVLAI